MRTCHFKPIGVIRTPFYNIQDMPIQPSGARGVRGSLRIDPAYQEGIKDLDGFSHLFLIYVFHQVDQPEMTVVPFLDQHPHGVFATRAPKRPNPIGLSVVRLISLTENNLILEDVDMLDGSPLLDIKPFVPAFDQPENVRIGWLNQRDHEVETKRSDDRFE
jgi:tRNA-Thr(GGU) m(6)t(6)A37 methyltransferase TsaA